jgi:hypothetical protein
LAEPERTPEESAAFHVECRGERDLGVPDHQVVARARREPMVLCIGNRARWAGLLANRAKGADPEIDSQRLGRYCAHRTGIGADAAAFDAFRRVDRWTTTEPLGKSDLGLRIGRCLMSLPEAKSEEI